MTNIIPEQGGQSVDSQNMEQVAQHIYSYLHPNLTKAEDYIKTLYEVIMHSTCYGAKERALKDLKNIGTRKLADTNYEMPDTEPNTDFMIGRHLHGKTKKGGFTHYVNK